MSNACCVSSGCRRRYGFPKKTLLKFLEKYLESSETAAIKGAIKRAEALSYIKVIFVSLQGYSDIRESPVL